MLAVEEALARIVAGLAPLPAEWCHLGAALGRVLATDLVATRDQPPHAISAMDGYAVRAADLAGGSATLRQIGAAPAGGTFEGAIGPGETVRIFTGGRLPPGADAVALQENATVDGDRIGLEGKLGPGTYVRPAGLDFKRGDLGLAAGTVLSARKIGLAAALNHAWLAVRRRPRVALLATGDELVMPGHALAAHQIVNSNSAALAAMVTAWGARALRSRHRGRPPRGPCRDRAAAGRFRSAGHPGRRLGRGPRPGADRAGRARPRARLLADRDAPRQATDVRPDPRRTDAGPARQSGLRRGLRDPVRARRDPRVAGPRSGAARGQRDRRGTARGQ